MCKQILYFIVSLSFSLNIYSMGSKPPVQAPDKSKVDKSIGFFQPKKSNYVTAPDGVRVHYITMGAGTPVFLIHGYYADAEVNWFKNGIAKELAQTNYVVAIDVRGHGRSDKPYRSRFYGANLWKDVLLVMDDLSIDQAHFHGFSMGGSILTQVLYHTPGRVLSATFGGSGVSYNNALNKQFLPDSNATESVKKAEDSARNYLLSAAKPSYLALSALARNAPWNSYENSRIDLKKVSQPVLGINGEFDSADARTSRMANELKDFQSVVLINKSHLTSVTPGYMPKQYRDKLVKFIRDND